MTRLNLKHKLLLCNAYPSSHKMTATQNMDAIVEASQGIGFRECRYVGDVRLQQGDKLAFKVSDTAISGTFLVGALPITDAVLLLILEKRDEVSSMVSFQSFAFPQLAGRNDAQVAVIDAFRGNSTRPTLQMEDHITEKEQQTVSKRLELLNFNRVYAIEEGRYDASITDSLDDVSGALLQHMSKKTLKLARGENYVVLRTGGGDYAQGLTVYPSIRSSGSRLGPGLAFLLLLCHISC